MNHFTWGIRTCNSTGALPRPPAGPWLQSVEVCAANVTGYLTTYTLDLPCVCGVVYVMSPYTTVDGDQAAIRITVDGSTTTLPIADLSPVDVATPPPFCIVTTQPLLPIPCGGP